ncbi:MAG: CpsD/CapB family tyrosine-protein kinase, partial [Cyanobacteria bacterium P01_F01_bin.143]
AFSGVGLGFILALATIVALESRNPTLKNIAEISELFNSKILGEIPNLRKSDFHLSHRSDPVALERFVLEAPYSVACEAYKIVYDNLLQARPDQAIKLISVVSSSMGEGKSTFISNLAALTTQLGKKVLIIDANSQTPRQKEIWKIDNNLGLTDILKKDAEFADVVQSPSMNLNVITAGSMVEDYLSLWESASMSEFINRVREQYDLVLFDTPAIALSTDALKITQFTDGMILVGRIGFTNPKISLDTKELIKQSHQEMLGIVVNDKFNS